MYFNLKCYNDKNYKIKKFVPETKVTEIPMSLEIYKKYFPNQENIQFIKLRISNIGLYSIATPKLSKKITDIIKDDSSDDIVITDALSNMGGMTLGFSKTFKSVNACEIIPLHCDILKNNLKVYKRKNVSIFCDDYMNIMLNLEQDIIFFDPPWGGLDFKKKKQISLEINNVNICCIINLLLEKKSAKIIYLLTPYNFNLMDLQDISCKSIKIHKLDPERKNKSKLLIAFT